MEFMRYRFQSGKIAEAKQAKVIVATRTEDSVNLSLELGVANQKSYRIDVSIPLTEAKTSGLIRALNLDLFATIFSYQIKRQAKCEYDRRGNVVALSLSA